MVTDAWRGDWRAFAELVARLDDEGRTAAELSANFGSQTVIWVGTLAKCRLDAEYSPGVDLQMPLVSVALRDGKRLVAQHLAAKVRPHASDAWRSVPQGAVVTFRARISASVGPFAAVAVARDDIDDEATLMLMVDDAEVVAPPSN